MKYFSLIFSLAAISTQAATWYVDSAVATSGDGRSWSSAWKNLSNIGGIAAGDTVYISGGPAGSTKSYAVSGWTPISGTAGNPITYKIGQDSQNNGTAVFTGSGNWVKGPFAYVIISGDAGDGQMHFSCVGYSTPIYSFTTGTVTHDARFSYINLGNATGLNGIVFRQGYANEVDNCSIRMISSGADVCVWIPQGAGAAAYGTTLKFHHNTVIVPGVSASGGIGCDGMQFGGKGYTIHDNRFIGMIGEGGINHMDLIQAWGVSYCLVYNNYFYGSAQSGVYVSNQEVGASQRNFYVFNNIFDTCQRSFDNHADNTCPSVTEESAFNNLAVNGQVLGWGFGFRDEGGSSWIDCWHMNNADYQMFGGNNIDSTVGQASNVSLSSSPFLRYTAGSTNNDYHLTSVATALIGKGTNLTAFVAAHPGTEALLYDKDGRRRPASGAWDIGPYQYSSGTGTNPVIIVTPSSIAFGPVLQGQTVTNSFTVRNAGAGTLSGTATVQAPFTILSGASYSLGTDQSQVVKVAYTPSTLTSDSKTLTLTGGGGATVSLTGSKLTVQAGLSFPSTAGAITAPFTSSTSGYVSQPVLTTLVSSGGKAVYGFYLENGGDYVVQANVNAPTAAANSFWVNVDGDPTGDSMIWDVPVNVGFTNQLVSWRGTGTDSAPQFVPAVFRNLAPGAHKLVVVGREAGAQLGQISILPASATTPPSPPARVWIVGN